MRNDENNSMIKRARQVLLPFAAVLILLFCAAGSQVSAQTSKEANRQDRTFNAFPDVEAMDQDGKPLHFYSDLIKGKKVIVNFIFTSCTYICPMQGASFPSYRLRSATS